MPDFMTMINHRLIPILEDLSNSDYQLAVWGKKHPKYRDNWSEAYEEIFEVYQYFAEADELGERSLSKINLALLQEIRDAMFAFKISDEEHQHSELLVKNPEWIKIQKLAGRLLKCVKDELKL